MKQTYAQIQQFRKTLPTYQVRDELVKAIMSEEGCSNVTIVSSATGSGKSTQIPQYLLEHDKKLHITVTQPRRVAAISIAERVAAERGEPVGESVGYSVRFLERAGKNTHIKYCTDGIAVREALDNKTFKGTDVFIVDEAHERSVQTDILLGLLKEALQVNHKLKVVIMSATMNT